MGGFQLKRIAPLALVVVFFGTIVPVFAFEDDDRRTLHAQPIYYVSLGVRSSSGECALLLGTGRSYTNVLSHRAYCREYLRIAGRICAGFHTGSEENRESNQPLDPR